MIEKFNLIPHIKKLYESGGNIIDFLKKNDCRNFNTIEDILISYDFQAGSYSKFVEENPEYIDQYTSALAKVISNLGDFHSIMEAGVGEATTLGNLAMKMNESVLHWLGFDISWSRIYYGQKYLQKFNKQANLFVADLFNIPLPDSSVDIIYTSHSIEPNGGREKEAIAELYRVAGKYVILLEPTAEFADDKGKERMKTHGYVHRLKDTIEELGYSLVEYKLFPVISNPLNPTGLYVIKKELAVLENKPDKKISFTCPISQTILQEYQDHFFSPSSLISYPKIMDIPCLSATNGILTSKHE